MKKYFLITLLSLLSLTGNAQRQWTLEECIDTALVNNRQVKQQALTKENRDIAYNQARLNLLPNLNAGAGQSFSFGRSLDENNSYQSSNSSNTSFNVSSNLTLFDGLRLKNSIDARKADMYASKADLETMKFDIILSVNTAYLQVLMNKELLQLAEEQLALTKENIEQKKILVENGRAAEGELYELQAQQAKEELRRIEADNTLRLSLLDLAQIMELDNFNNLDVVMSDDLLVGNLSLISVDDVYNNAINNRPEMKSAEYQLLSSEKEVAIARSAYFPSLSFGAQFGTGYYNLNNIPSNSFGKQLSDNRSTGINFNLSVPIFNRMEVKNKVRSALLNVESQKLKMENTKMELRKTIQQAYQNALAAKARWDAAVKSEKSMQEAYRYTNQKFEVGRATQYELFQAKNNLTQVLSEQTQAKFEYIFKLKILEMYNEEVE